MQLNIVLLVLNEIALHFGFPCLFRDIRLAYSVHLDIFERLWKGPALNGYKL